MSVVLSFFDYTGNAGRVWVEAMYESNGEKV